MSNLAAPPVSLLRAGWLRIILIFLRKVIASRLLRFRLVSWFRTPERNRIEGGAEESQHLFALAMDFSMPEDFVQNVADEARRHGLVADTLGRSRLHVQLFPKGALARAGVTFPR